MAAVRRSWSMALIVVATLATGCLHGGDGQEPGRRIAAGSQLEDQRLAFVAGHPGDAHIYVMNPDVGDVRQLTGKAAAGSSTPRDGAPAFSPDGRLIVFERTPVHPTYWPSEIYVMNADGSEQRRLTANRRSDFGPSFSPNGRRIIYTSCATQAPSCDIVTVDKEGRDRQILLDEPTFLTDAAWSPDGTRIAYARMHAESHFQHMEIHVMGADGEDDRRLTENETGDGSPAWSPDGRKLAFVSNRAPSARCFSHDCVGYTTELYVMDADGGGVRRLTRTAAEEHAPVWSPDGVRIVVGRLHQGQLGSELWMMNADGTCPTRLRDGSSPDWYGPQGATVGPLDC
jgi:TolB protein